MTVSDEAHSLSVWFVLALRLVMGVAFTDAGLAKIIEPFDARGYLLYATPENGSPLADLIVTVGSSDLFVAVVTWPSRRVNS